MTGTTQGVLTYARNYIPDPKTRNKSVRGEEIGRTSLATGSRETFYVKQVPTATVSVYVEPYKFSSYSTLATTKTTAKIFMWAASTLSVIFPDGASDTSVRPSQFRPVLAFYEYSEQLPYSYSDNELADFLPAAISYINNTFETSYTFTGSGSTVNPVYTTAEDKELISKALSIIVRRSFVNEQQAKGLGVKVRGPLHSIDSIAAMKSYVEGTKSLEKDLQKFYVRNKIAGITSSGKVIDIYSENTVST